MKLFTSFLKSTIFVTFFAFFGLVHVYAATTLPTGGSITTFVGNGTNGTNGTTYRVHTFTTNETFDTQGSDVDIEYLLVAGGGSGGGSTAGGGGAGGLLTNLGGTLLQKTAGIYPVIIGSGGASANQQLAGNNGANTTFDTLNAVGGGGGSNTARANNGNPGKNGGSGGGATKYGSKSNTYGNGILGQGNNGGNFGTDNFPGGGGGGAGSVGQDGGVSKSGDGGIGISSSISGTANYYAGGGGGGSRYNGGLGGLGGGGNGTSNGRAGADGLANTGGGGGGGWLYSGGSGGAGGSGIAIIRYSLSTISYDGNTNDAGANPAPETNVINGENVSLATAGSLGKTGYSFAGWNTAADASGTSYPAGSNIRSTGSDITLYAEWTANTYTVSFDGNTADGGSAPANMLFTYDTAQNLNTNSFTKTGYSFAGWNTAADGSGVSYAESAHVNNLSSTDLDTIILYAQWSLATYSIGFDANAGTGTMVDQNFSYQVTQALTTNTFNRSGLPLPTGTQRLTEQD